MSTLVDYLHANHPGFVVHGDTNHFGNIAEEYSSACSGAAKFPLISLGVIKVTGADAETFLNGQFTTNVAELVEATAQFSAWCDPKGRVLYLFTIVREDDDYLLILQRSLIKDFASRLKMYVLRAAVEIADISSDIVLLGRRRINQSPAEGVRPWAVTRSPDGMEITVGLVGERSLIAVPADQAVAYWDQIEGTACGEYIWQTFDIHDGLPIIVEQTRGEFLPQHLNLDALEAVNFRKGCYPGQEVIARLKFRGEVKKRLVTAIFSENAEVEPGALIRHSDDQRKIGNVLLARTVGERQTLVAAVCDLDSPASSWRIENVQDSPTETIPLSYSIE